MRMKPEISVKELKFSRKEVYLLENVYTIIEPAPYIIIELDAIWKRSWGHLA